MTAAAQRPAVARAEVDGVPVLWAQGPEPFTAGLVFGVGRRHESFARGGVTHLVEHLVMGGLGRTTLDCNAHVDLDTTQFTAAGRPERVAEFLRRVCEALADPPVERLAVEADVLRAEAEAVERPVVAALLAEQYGGRGVGLAGFGEVGLPALTAQDVRDWAATRFVRPAAALWLSGPPPDGLALPLRHAEPAPRPEQPRRELPVPVLVEHPFDGAVALGAEVVRTPALGAACRLLRDRAEDDLRHRRGLSYVVSTDSVVVDARRRFVVVSADCRDGQEAVAARALWQALVRLAEAGPSADELAHDRAALAEHLADPRSVVDELSAAAESLVTGTPCTTAEELEREARELTGEAVRDAARAVREAALVGVPYGVDAGVPALSRLPEWSADVVAGRTYRRRLRSDAPRRARLVVGDGGASLVLRPGEQVTVRYADALGLVEDGPQEWQLVGADGRTVPIAARDWRDGEQAVAAVVAAVPERLRVAARQAHDGARRVLLLHAPPQAAEEAVWPSRRDAWVARDERWTLLVRQQDEADAYADAAGLSAALGRRAAVLLLTQAHAELSVVVLQRGRERDRHLWTGDPHDPAVLARVLGADQATVASLLAHPGPPHEVLAALVRELGLPRQVADVLAGVPLAEVAGLVHEPARGVREHFAKLAQGAYDPPDSRALVHRLGRWERERPPAYRAVNAVSAVGQGALAAWLAGQAHGDWTSWRGLLAGVLGLSAAGSLWSTRAPGRRSTPADRPAA